MMSQNNTSAICNATSSLNFTAGNNTCGQQRQEGQDLGLGMPAEARILFIFLYAMVFFFGVLGNSVVCFVIGKKKELSGGDVFMLSLAVADLLAALFVPIMAIHDFISNLQWKLGRAMCTLLPAMSPVTLAASSWSLVLIAADRYRIIAKPMKPRLSMKVKLCGILFIWVIAIGISMPYILAQRLQHQQGFDYCIEAQGFMTQLQKDVYVIIFISVGWIIPIIIISVLYRCSILHLSRNSFSNDNNDSMQRRVIQNKKVIQMFTIVTGLFCFCTMPYSVYYATVNYLLAYSTDVDFKVIWTLNYFLFALVNINSCMNPFIYARRQPEMRRFVCSVLNKFCCRTSKTGKGSTSTNAGKHDISSNEAFTRESAMKSVRTETAVSGTFHNKAFSNIE